MILVALFSLGQRPQHRSEPLHRSHVRRPRLRPEALPVRKLPGPRLLGRQSSVRPILVTSSGNLITNLLGFVGNLLEQLLGIQSVEADRLLPLPQKPITTIPSGLYDRLRSTTTGPWSSTAMPPSPQPKSSGLADAQNGFNVAGSGIVAVIDTGVDVNHPVLSPVLLPGYDFTRNQPGASEWLDVPQLQNGNLSNGSQNRAASCRSAIQRRDSRSIFGCNSGWRTVL